MSKSINYRITVKINKSIQEVCEKLFDYDLLKYHQQPPLITYHLMRGKTLEKGAVTRLFYNYNGTKIYMDEYVIDNQLPTSITLLYTMGDIKNKMTYSFSNVNDQNTLWTNEVIFEFVDDFTVDKLHYIKQTEEDMKAFKEYIERD